MAEQSAESVLLEREVDALHFTHPHCSRLSLGILEIPSMQQLGKVSGGLLSPLLSSAGCTEGLSVRSDAICDMMEYGLDIRVCLRMLYHSESIDCLLYIL